MSATDRTTSREAPVAAVDGPGNLQPQAPAGARPGDLAADDIPLSHEGAARTLRSLAVLLAVVAAQQAVEVVGGNASAVFGIGIASFFVVVFLAANALIAADRPGLALGSVAGTTLVAAALVPALRWEFLLFTSALPPAALAAAAPVATRGQLRVIAAAGWLAALVGVAAAVLAHPTATPGLGVSNAGWLLGVAAAEAAALLALLRMDERRRDQADQTRMTNRALREANAALSRAEARYRELFDANPIPMWLYDLDTTRILAVNDAALLRYGWTRQEFLALTIDDLRPAGEEDVFSDVVRLARRGEPVRGRFRHRTRSGRVIEVESQGISVMFQGRLARAVAAIDVSEREFLAAERDILLDLSADLVITGDFGGRLERASRGARDVLGLEPGQVSPQQFLRLVHGDDRGRVVRAFRQLRAGGRVTALEIRLRTTGGDYRWFDWRASVDPIRRIVYAAARDVTTIRELEEQHRHGERMRAVGRLAGGVAHDFNNLITAISGHAAFAASSVPADSPAADDIEAIRQAAGRAQVLTSQLLAFGRPGAGAPRRVTLREVCDRVEPMLRRLVPENISLGVRHVGRDRPVLVDPDNLERVIVNLVANARDAMPQGGQLEIVTLSHHERMDGALREVAALEVRDTGTGMSSEVRARIFEPFFTTKPVGKGSGLGLASAYGFVTLAGGRVDVETSPGTGSIFRVVLPALDTDEDGDRDGAEPKPGRGAAGLGPEATVQVDGAAGRRATNPSAATILVVEDDPGIRALAARILAREGHRVLVAENAAAAMAICADEPAVDVVFSDIVMPGRNGRDLVADLAARRPGLRVLLTSGYEEEVPPPDGDSPPFLAKPYEPAALVAQVAALLRPAANGGREECRSAR